MKSLIVQAVFLGVLAIFLFGFVLPWFSNLTLLPGAAIVFIEVMIVLVYLWLVGMVGSRIYLRSEKKIG